MSIGSEIRDERPLGDLAGAPATSFSGHAIRNILTMADGAVILLSSLAGGFGYKFWQEIGIPSIWSYFTVGLLASPSISYK